MVNLMMLDWLCWLIIIVIFIVFGDKCEMVLIWVLYEVIEVEIICFVVLMDQMGNGWGKGMEIFEEVFVELKVQVLSCVFCFDMVQLVQ